jgi:hypothetical protein
MVAHVYRHKSSATHPREQRVSSSVIGGINIFDNHSKKGHCNSTLVEIPNGVFIGGDVTTGGGEPMGLDSWVPEVTDWDS